jgi:hypothetical protein
VTWLSSRETSYRNTCTACDCFVFRTEFGAGTLEMTRKLAPFGAQTHHPTPERKLLMGLAPQPSTPETSAQSPRDGCLGLVQLAH